MEEKYEFDQLLVAYFLKELNAEQEAFVIQAINKDQELKKRFEEYEQLWRLLGIKKNIDGINIELERRRLQEKLNPGKLAALNVGADADNPLQEHKKPARIYRILKATAIAASVILVIGLGWNFLRPKVDDKPGVAIENKQQQAAAQFYAQTESNTTGKTRKLLLEDGTEVLLWNGSEISFSKPFAPNKRDVVLKGKADFKVAKDKTKPFTVYSGDITTRALGTEFLITNYEKEKTITVRLLEGSVVVKSADSIKNKLNESFYLAAGEELLYNKENATALVRNFRDGLNQMTGKSELVKDNPSLPKNKEGSWYMFNNQSLPEIFDELENMFGVDIVYRKKELERLYFIGKFEKTDSLDYILRNIAMLNNLSLSKQKSQYTIRKKTK